MDTQILLDHEPVADGGYLVRALLKITGTAPDADDRPTLNLAVVLDRSGSMSGPKLDQAKDAAELLVRRLADDDVVSVITYDDEVRTLAARVPGAGRDGLLQRLRGVRSGGTTNLSGGWLRGRELVADGLTDGAINRVLLLTDGLANVGITDPGQLRDLAASAATDGVSTTTIGFGAGYDEHLLRSMADAGGGSTYYIEAPDQAPAVFETEIEGLMALAAQNVAVTVAPAPAVDHAVVLHDYPRQPTDDDTLRLELGDLYALEPKTLLCEFLLSCDADAAEVDVATLTLEGHVLLPGGGVEKRTITLPIRVSPEEAAVVNPEVRREALLLEAARTRRDALDDRSRGAFEDGARKLREVAEKLAPLAADDAEIRDEHDDLRDLAERFDTAQVREADAKWMYQRSYSVSASKKAMMEAARKGRADEREKRRRK